MGKTKKAAGPSDDQLLDMAIAENTKAKAAAAETAAQEAKAAKKAAAASTPGLTPSTSEVLNKPAKAALSRPEIIKKLNRVPSFCVLNGDSNIVAATGPDGSGEVTTWFTDAPLARGMVASAKQHNPEVAADLHLGVTPLGLAFALSVKWMESTFYGDLRLQTSDAVLRDMGPSLAQQVTAQGLEAGSWQLPTFCCDELSSDTVMPVFFDPADLTEAWVASGRSRESVPQNLAVIELRVLVAQMQTDSFAWSTVEFVGSPKAAALVREAKTAAIGVATRKAGELGLLPAHDPAVQAAASGGAAPEADEPPPLQ